MNAKSSLTWAALVLGMVVVLAGCQSGGGGGSSSGDGKEVGFKFDMPYHLKSVGAGGGGALIAGFSASDVMTGQLVATNTDTSVAQTFDWSIYLDEDTLDVQSNKTIILDPGTYDFALLVSQGDHQYAGEALAVAIVDGENDVPLTIRPIIGDVTTNVNIVARLIDLRFEYLSAEFAGAGISDPRIGITVDGGMEQIFDVDSVSGLSEYMMLNLSPGGHTFELRLLDGALQRGKSLDAQEAVVLSPGVDVHMDLVALHGEVVLSLTEEGGDATFIFTIPAEVVDEAGGTGDLEVRLNIARTESAPQSGDEQVLSLSPNGPDYSADVTIPGFQFEAVWISLTFTDVTDDYLLGSCTHAVMLSTSDQSSPCELTLVRRAAISGNLLATLGVNVFNAGSEPLAGVPVYANGNFVGITGAGGFGTPGYLKVYLVAGGYTIHAEDGGMSGESGVSLDSLGIDNVDVILDDAIAADILLIGQPYWGGMAYVQSYLAPYFPTIDAFNNTVGTPTLAQVLPYDAVVTWGDGCMVNTNLLGDVLADYVDAGGGVVMNTFSQLAPGCIELGGRFASEQYSPFVGTSQNHGGGPHILGTVDLPGHPIMAGVNTLSVYWKEGFPGGLAPGAQRIASYSNGDPVAAVGASGEVAYVNFYPTPVDPFYLAGDFARLLANALSFVASH